MTRALEFVIAVLIACALCIGCQLDERGLNYDDITRIYVDPAVPADMAFGGCDAWSPVGVRCELVTEPRFATVAVLPDGVLDCEPDAAGNLWVGQGGWYDGEGPNYRVYLRVACGFDAASPANWPTTIAHEFGHAFGLAHVDVWPPALMGAVTYVDGPTVPTEADVAEWRRVHQ